MAYLDRQNIINAHLQDPVYQYDNAKTEFVYTRTFQERVELLGSNDRETRRLARDLLQSETQYNPNTHHLHSSFVTKKQLHQWQTEKEMNECPWQTAIFVFCVAAIISLICFAALHSYIALICACSFAGVALMIYGAKCFQDFRPRELIRYESSLKTRENI